MKKIGIIGRGFVGTSVEFGFSAMTGCNAEVRSYDKDPSKSIHSLEETVNESDFIFLSVPTPSNPDGSMHLGILESALKDIENVNKRNGNIILIRSTVVPGTTEMLAKKFTKLNIVFNPEFLTERSAKFDFINQARFILGGRKRNKVDAPHGNYWYMLCIIYVSQRVQPPKEREDVTKSKKRVFL